MRKFYFTHRPPTTGVHLLSDPFPPLGNGDTAIRLHREYLEMLKQSLMVNKSKKSRSQS